MAIKRLPGGKVSTFLNAFKNSSILKPYLVSFPLLTPLEFAKHPQPDEYAAKEAERHPGTQVSASLVVGLKACAHENELHLLKVRVNSWRHGGSDTARLTAAAHSDTARQAMCTQQH